MLTKYGQIEISYDYHFCRYCNKGVASAIINKIRLLEEHKVTMEMADLIAYAGQIAMSFEKSSEMIEKFTQNNSE